MFSLITKEAYLAFAGDPKIIKDNKKEENKNRFLEIRAVLDFNNLKAKNLITLDKSINTVYVPNEIIFSSINDINYS